MTLGLSVTGHPLLILIFFLIIKQQQQKENTRNKTYNVWKIREFCQFPSVLTL